MTAQAGKKYRVSVPEGKQANVRMQPGLTGKLLYAADNGDELPEATGQIIEADDLAWLECTLSWQVPGVAGVYGVGMVSVPVKVYIWTEAVAELRTLSDEDPEPVDHDQDPLTPPQAAPLPLPGPTDLADKPKPNYLLYGSIGAAVLLLTVVVFLLLRK